MGKTLKNLATGINDNQLAQTVKDSAQQIWLAGLGAFAKAQEEGGKVFDALVKEGESIQHRTRKMTDEKIAVVTGKATGTWDRLEQVFEERVARALGSLGVPSKKEIDQLSKRVSELTAAVETLTGKKVGKPAVTPAVKAVTSPPQNPPQNPLLNPPPSPRRSLWPRPWPSPRSPNPPPNPWQKRRRSQPPRSRSPKLLPSRSRQACCR